MAAWRDLQSRSGHSPALLRHRARSHDERQQRQPGSRRHSAEAAGDFAVMLGEAPERQNRLWNAALIMQRDSDINALRLHQPRKSISQGTLDPVEKSCWNSLAGSVNGCLTVCGSRERRFLPQ